MMNNEYRSLRKSEERRKFSVAVAVNRLKNCNSFQLQFSALKGRNISARGNALGQESNADFVAPRLNIVRGSTVAWGKINDDCSKIKNGFIYFKNKENPEGKRGQKNNMINKVSITGMRFRVEPSGWIAMRGITATGKTTRLAVRNRLTHNMQPSEMTEKKNVEFRMMINEFRKKNW